jgi:hypothetical protein
MKIGEITVKVLAGILIVACTLMIGLFVLPFLIIGGGYVLMKKPLRKIYINLGALILTTIFTAMIGSGVFYIYIEATSPKKTSIGMVILSIFMMVMGFIYLLITITQVIYPNIEKLKKKHKVLALIRALEYDDWGVKGDAAKALEEIGDERAKEPLLKYYTIIAQNEADEYNMKRPSGTYF